MDGSRLPPIYLHVNEKTARKYKAELGLPVYRVGGRYRADTAKLDLWQHDRKLAQAAEELDKSNVEARSHGRRAAAKNRLDPWRVRVRLSGLALIMLAATAKVGMTPEFPVKAVPRDTGLEVFNERGNVLWTYPFPYADPVVKVQTLIRDVDQDGLVEVLLSYQPPASLAESGRLVCLSHTGAVRWQISYSAHLTIGDRYFEPIYLGHHLRWLEARGESFVLIVARHHKWYPTHLVLLDPASGKPRAKYWHPGVIEAITEFDVDLDGTTELLVGGVNNPGHGIGHPSLAVLDVPFREPDPQQENFFDTSNALAGGSNAYERAYLLFPRLDYLEIQRYVTSVTGLQVQDPERLQVSISAQDQTEIVYYLDRELRILDVFPSDTLVQNHDLLYLQGALSHAYQARELEGWRTVRRFATAPDGNSPEILSLLQPPSP